jgi:hypothetical protein
VARKRARRARVNATVRVVPTATGAIVGAGLGLVLRPLAAMLIRRLPIPETVKSVLLWTLPLLSSAWGVMRVRRQ